MANHYYIISEVLFFENRNDKENFGFVSGTGVDLNNPCHSQIPTLTELKQALVDFGLETKEILNQGERIELSATQKDKKELQLIFTDVKDQNKKVGMFEVGRGSDFDLIIDFIKSLAQIYGKFL